jgi:hypothetical protein
MKKSFAKTVFCETLFLLDYALFYQREFRRFHICERILFGSAKAVIHDGSSKRFLMYGGAVRASVPPCLLRL